uniref:hypothetical protein n=1 Tax=Faecalibacterium prausnitzii TaxID=853 RepID=UPI00402726B7
GRGDSKHPSLPLARAERKPLDQKKKPAPRHQREKDLWSSFPHKRELQQPEKYRYLQNKIRSFSITT